VQKTLEQYTEDNIAVYVIFEQILRGSFHEKMAVVIPHLTHPAIKIFWTENKMIGTEFAETLKWKKGTSAGPTPWDVYMLYPPEVKWKTEPPVPRYKKFVVMSEKNLRKKIDKVLSYKQ